MANNYHESYQHPKVDREHKLQPCFAVGVQSIVETCFNAKVQILCHAMKTDNTELAGRKIV